MGKSIWHSLLFSPSVSFSYCNLYHLLYPNLNFVILLKFTRFWTTSYLNTNQVGHAFACSGFGIYPRVTTAVPRSAEEFKLCGGQSLGAAAY
jgi:hypothetical protein